MATDDRPGHRRHDHQRQPRQQQQPDGRWRLQPRLGFERQHDQQRQHRLHRSGRDPDVELRRRQGAQRRRRHQRRHQERHQQVQRQLLEVLPERQVPLGELLRAEGRRAATGSRPRTTSTTTAAGSAGRSSRTSCSSSPACEFRSLDRQESPQRRTLPTRAELQGNFSARILGPDGVAGTTDDNNIPDSLRNPATGRRSPTTPFRRTCSPPTAARSRTSTTG